MLIFREKVTNLTVTVMDQIKRNWSKSKGIASLYTNISLSQETLFYKISKVKKKE